MFRKSWATSFKAICLVFLVFTSSVANTKGASAAESISPNSSFASIGLALPVPTDSYGSIKFSQAQHPSDFKSTGGTPGIIITITNAGKGINSSIDLSYKGKVVAPISGEVKIFKDCGTGGTILFIRNSNGHAIGIVHIVKMASIHDGSVVTQGQYIGDVIYPQNNSCGNSLGYHVHLTWMTWQAGTNKFTEVQFTNIYIGQWIIQANRMTSAFSGRQVYAGDGNAISDVAKITSVRSGKVIDAWTAGTQIWTYSSGNKNQQWIIIPALNDPGYYFLKSVSRNQCMVAPDMNNGTLIVFSSCWKENQKFKLVPSQNAPGKWNIKSKTSGKVLDVITNWSDTNSGKANGTRIQQWELFNGNNQQWTFSKP